MTAQRSLSTNARLAIGALIIIVLGIIFLAVRNLVTTMQPVAVVAQSDSGDNQLVVIGGQTQYFDRSTRAGKIADWLNTSASRTQAFSVGEQNFKPGSDEPTPQGWTRLARLAGLMKSDSDLSAHLFITVYEGSDAANKQQLAQKRAERVRAEIIARGIDPSRIDATAQQPISAGDPSKQKPPMMVLVLTK